MVHQIQFSLPPFPRGYHLITDIIEKQMKDLPETGLVHIFLKHTSAALTINENADPTVRDDFESFLNKLVPEHDPVYRHVFEGADDMPAHLKASLLGPAITIPVSRRRLNMGTWQGIYLGEFRNRGGARKLVLTMYG